MLLDGAITISLSDISESTSSIYFKYVNAGEFTLALQSTIRINTGDFLGELPPPPPSPAGGGWIGGVRYALAHLSTSPALLYSPTCASLLCHPFVHDCSHDLTT